MNETPELIERDIAAIGRIGAVPMILRVICQSTGMGFAAVARVSDATWTACAVHDDIAFGLGPGGQLELKTTLCHEVRLSGRIVAFDDALEDPVYCEHHTPKMYGLRSYISVPIRTPGGEYFGNLCAIDPRPMQVSQQKTVDMFTLFAELIGTQLDTERRHTETGAALANERETSELREQFIAVLGHDLRNPLSAVAAIGGLLKRNPATVDLPGLGQRLVNSTKRMSSLIDDVLDFARGRLGAGLALRLSREDSLDLLLSDVVAEVQLAHEGRDIDWLVDVTHPMRCDASRVQQLLSNLAKNALTHGARDQPVRIEARTSPQALTLTVHNRGEPIPPDQQTRLFEPFWRPTTSHVTQGLGLGLYICAQIVKAHGGTLKVTSNADDGTRFTAVLPLG
jgi:signal transduction histidine kinase